MINSFINPATSKTTWALPVAVAVLLVLHCVGLWGLLLSGQTIYFQELTPFNLLISVGLLLGFHRDWRASFFLFLSVCFLTGFFSEVLGVHTGLLFGNYTYGNALGIKLFQVPLLIGINWIMLVYATGSLTNRFALPKWLKILAAATLMVALDFLIEPIAVTYDFWSWQNNIIPLSNYLGWLVVAVFLQVIFFYFSFNKQNKLAPWLLGIQAIFFIVLNLTL